MPVGSIDLYSQALTIAEKRKYSFYDSLIISAAIYGKCGILYSEDLQHGQIIQKLTIKNPFKQSGGDLTTVSARSC